MRGSPSIAATSCISEVPGLAKHTSTPAFANALINTSAPVTTVLASLFVLMGY
jgi:hypothetical protein